MYPIWAESPVWAIMGSTSPPSGWTVVDQNKENFLNFLKWQLNVRSWKNWKGYGKKTSKVKEIEELKREL